MAYEWWTAADATPPRALMTNETRVATKGELENLLAHLVDELDACGFLRNAPKRPGMVRNLRHLFQRGEVTEQELRTLHGVVTELALGRRGARGATRRGATKRNGERRHGAAAALAFSSSTARSFRASRSTVNGLGSRCTPRSSMP